jgi:cell division protein FtsB
MKYGNRSSSTSSFRRFFYSPLGIVVACIIFVLIVRGAWSVHQKALIAQERLDQAQTELADLQHQQASLSASIGQLSTTQGIETALREKYHAVKPGEMVAVIIDDPHRNSSSSSSASSTPQISWWGRLLGFIGL